MTGYHFPKLLFVLAGFFVLAGSAFAESPFDVEVEKVTEDIYVFHRNPSYRNPVQANITAIINETDVIMVDGGYPGYTENVIRELKKITGKPVSVVITTHWHQDHNWGDYVYREYFPEVRIIAHENTRRTLSLRNDLAPAQAPDFREERRPAFEGFSRSLAEAGQHQDVVAWAKLVGEDFDALYDDIDAAQDSLADETFQDRLVFYRGARTIEVLHLGRANTDGDTIVWLPEEKIVITGDIVVRPTPYGFYSYPQEWAETLQQIQALGYDILIPGHGDLQYDREYVTTLIDLMESLTTQTIAAVAGGADSVEAVREAVDFSEFDAKIAGDDPLLQYLFLRWFKTPILESAFKAARGEEILQYDPENIKGETE